MSLGRRSKGWDGLVVSEGKGRGRDKQKDKGRAQDKKRQQNDKKKHMTILRGILLFSLPASLPLPSPLPLPPPARPHLPLLHKKVVGTVVLDALAKALQSSYGTCTTGATPGPLRKDKQGPRAATK